MNTPCLSPNWAMTIKETCAALNMARSKLYYLLDPKSRYYDPTFPKPIRIGKGSVRLDRSAVMAWYVQQQGGRTCAPTEAFQPAYELAA